jgi:branched-chain amino acid transport system permease protein
MNNLMPWLRKNRMLAITLAILVLLFLMSMQGMETSEWVITSLRGFSVGAVIFLVASGFSIIFGLMDVLNLAHGALFMVGAYVGWTVFVRPDTFVDAITPIALFATGFVLIPFWTQMLSKIRLSLTVARTWPWVGLILGLIIAVYGLSQYPVTTWDPAVYAESPITYGFQAGQGELVLPEPELFTTSPYLVLVVLILGSILTTFSIVGLIQSRQTQQTGSQSDIKKPLPRGSIGAAVGLLIVGLCGFMFHGALTDLFVNMGSNLRLLVALLIAFLVGFVLGAIIEMTLIRPLYARPTYALLMTLGVGLILTEIVRAVWGRPEFTMPKPALMAGTGDGCPAQSIGGWLSSNCSTMEFMGTRVRTYNEIFVPLVGVLVLVFVWLLLQRTRLGMIIRAGVQDSEMVEALGINVRQIFTMVFALGVGLAALGGTIAGPSMGISIAMGDTLLITALIGMIIGGLTSFPGAAAGSLIVGLLQQFIIKYGQIGINIPFLDEPFKPTPPLVPASTVLLMVIVLLILPHGLFGRKE